MKVTTARIILLFALAVLAGCGGGDDKTTNTNTYAQPDSAICDASLIVSDGLLCAIQPSRLDGNSRDFYSNATTADFIGGFGYHAIAFPNTGVDIKGINIHLSGSYDRAYNQVSGKFGSSLFLNESLGAGYINIQLAYNNRFSISVDECVTDGAYSIVDNCAGGVREEKITGDDVSIVTDTPAADSIEYRLIKLVEFFENEGVVFAVDVVSNGAINWHLLRVSGHSQGATHALYLSKYFSASHACLLAGGYDVPDATPVIPPENMADWILDDSVQFDTNKITALFSTDDVFNDSFISVANYIGLVDGNHYETFSNPPYFTDSGTPIRGHGAVVFDPRFSQLRIDACF